MKRVLYGIGAATILMTGCGSGGVERSDLSQDTTTMPHKVDRAVVRDFINNDSVREVRSDNIHLSAAVVPANGNLAIRAHVANRRDLVHAAFYIDLDHDSSTGVQFSVRTNWEDQHAQPDGEVGADLIVTDGNLYYYNRHERRWRYWFHSFQPLGRVTYTRDTRNGDFIIELPRNIATAYHARADRNPQPDNTRIYQVPGDMDYSEIARRFNGNIRVAVELVNADWSVKVESNERPLEYTYDPDNHNNNNHQENNNHNNDNHTQNNHDNNHHETNNNHNNTQHNNNNHADFSVSKDGNSVNARLSHAGNFANNGLFIDSDNSSRTGYKPYLHGLGADYLVEGTHLYHYNGNGNNWSWKLVGSANTSVNNGNVNYSFSASSAHLGNTSKYIAKTYTENWHEISSFGPRTIHSDNNHANNNTTNTNHNSSHGSSSSNSIRVASGYLFVNATGLRSYAHYGVFFRDANSKNTRSGYLYEDGRLFKYDGNGHNWHWKYIQSIKNSGKSGAISIAVPIRLLNLKQTKVEVNLYNSNWSLVKAYRPVKVQVK